MTTGVPTAGATERPPRDPARQVRRRGYSAFFGAVAEPTTRRIGYSSPGVMALKSRRAAGKE
ncbi:hypothetical protein [Myxococcus virescens]|uniref:Uncharacterized protein n=1 Tax=Myxococcus virescens TaxID=83456 RepID=A0A511HG88_9BACT|nr:hypothetical protein [Myxococcus virescens]GEL72571.1 hypothetical protein MVI01_43550 [Myxococcus virescens]